MAWFSSRRVDTEIVLRAAAITGVCFNHSHPDRSFDYAGGMTVLFMLSGIAFARFALNGATPDAVRHSIARFAFRLWLPCAAIVAASFLVRRDIAWGELLFVSNWYTERHISFLFVWYPQVLLQILAALFVLFSAPFLARAFLRRPLAGALILLGVAIALRMADPLFRSGAGSALPHLQAWNFLLGWALFFTLAQRTEDDRPIRVLAALAVVGCAAWAHGPRVVSFWTLSIAGVALAFLPAIRMPALLAQPTLILGQATFAIFLLHLAFLRLYFAGLHFQSQTGAWLFTMGASTFCWIVGAAFLRTWRRRGSTTVARLRDSEAERPDAAGRLVSQKAG